MQDMPHKSVGLIATGDELTQGDILNTNGQYIVKALNDCGFHTPEHLIVADDEERIHSAIHYFRTRHNVIILTGGLGPTSDDRTRYALAAALGRELELHDEIWQQLQQRFIKLNLPIIEENRQQALFPQGAEILPNANGTAPGCYVQDQQIEYFMLPGPPRECLPMFNKYVLPKLTATIKQTFYQFKWLLLGANEGEIAAKLDKALLGLRCRTGYRWHYPYLDYKVFAPTEEALETAAMLSLPIVEEYLISKNQQTAIELLNACLAEQNFALHFADDILSQLIKFTLLTSKTHHYFCATHPHRVIEVRLEGFPEYFCETTLPKQCEFRLILSDAKQTIQRTFTFFYRDDQVKHHLAAIVAREIAHFKQ
jgi:nicotinamide-nucleotide amidase